MKLPSEIEFHTMGVANVKTLLESGWEDIPDCGEYVANQLAEIPEGEAVPRQYLVKSLTRPQSKRWAEVTVTRGLRHLIALPPGHPLRVEQVDGGYRLAGPRDELVRAFEDFSKRVSVYASALYDYVRYGGISSDLVSHGDDVPASPSEYFGSRFFVVGGYLGLGRELAGLCTPIIERTAPGGWRERVRGASPDPVVWARQVAEDEIAQAPDGLRRRLWRRLGSNPTPLPRRELESFGIEFRQVNRFGTKYDAEIPRVLRRALGNAKAKRKRQSIGTAVSRAGTSTRCERAARKGT